MDINSAAAMAYMMPVIKTGLMLFVGFVAVIGTGYYFFIIKKRRLWYTNIWEKKADGRIHLIGKDIVIEKRINKGKQLIYILKKSKSEVFPPPWESTYRLKGREYTDYVRVREDDYIPLKREVKLPFETKGEKKNLIELVRTKLKEIRSKGKEEMLDKYVYMPIENSLKTDFKFEAIDYDINMLRIATLDNREKLYADAQDWMQKYGHLVAIGVIVVLIIVVLYLSYDYSQNVIATAMGQTSKTISAIEQLSAKMGGVVPAS